MKTFNTLLTTLVLCASGVAVAASSSGSQGDVVEKTFTAQSPTGESMDVTQVMSQNADGSFTIIALKPADKVKAFYDRACKEEFGDKAHYSGLSTQTHLSEGAIHGYSCESSGDISLDQLTGN